jgi:hypothetical protein
MPSPALLIQTSMRPKRAITSSTTRLTSSRRLTFATIAIAFPPQRSATASSASLRRATSATDMPRRQSCSATAAPMPPLAPVITTIFGVMIKARTYHRKRKERARQAIRAGIDWYGSSDLVGHIA